MIHRTSNIDATFSVAELGGVRHLFASIAPCDGDNLSRQALDALRTIEAVADREGMADSIVQQTVFLSDPRQVETCRQIMRDFYGDRLPATSYIPQPPCSGRQLEIEVLGVAQQPGDVEVQRVGERAVIVRHNNVAWIHCANVVPDTPNPTVYDRSLDAFQRLDRELAALGVRFDQVVRTWLYLGDITGLEDESPRYQRLNRARTDFFQNCGLVGQDRKGGANPICYPASTGIGINGRDVLMSCLALSASRPDVLRVALENPRQIAAHDYDDRYGPQSPKFSRAMAIVVDGEAFVLISGTASILDSESHHLGDVAAQTRETFDNIAALISADNFGRHGLTGLGTTLDDLTSLRVYIKRQEDYPIVRDVCRATLGQVPTIYTRADLCRPELLVEIEGIAICGRA